MNTQKKRIAQEFVAAIRRRDIGKMRKLLAEGADPNTTESFTESGNVSVLNCAAGCQFSEAVELLLKAGADPNLPETGGLEYSGGGTALHSAITGIAVPGSRSGEEAERLKIVDLLIDAGADPNVVSDGDTLPLYSAATGGDIDIAQRLIKSGAYVKNTRPRCMPPLVGAAFGFSRMEGWKFEKIAVLLIEHGAPIDGQTTEGVTALMSAAYRGSECLVNLFLEHRADVNHQAKDGRTPLICAAQFARYLRSEEELQLALRIVKRLLEAGADPGLRSNKGETAYDIASRNKNPLVADYIKRFTTH